MQPVAETLSDRGSGTKFPADFRKLKIYEARISKNSQRPSLALKASKKFMNILQIVIYTDHESEAFSSCFNGAL